MNPSTVLNTITWLHGAFGIGGATLGAALMWIAHMRGLLGTAKGQADLKDAETILSAAADIAGVSTHPKAAQAVVGLTAILNDADKLAIPPTPASTINKAAALILLALLLAGSAHAAWLAGPGAFAETSLATVSKSDLSLQSVTDALGGFQYTAYTGSYVAVTGTGAVQYEFQANWYLGVDLGGDVSAQPDGSSKEYAYGGFTEGYSNGGISEGWRAGGPGGGMFLVGFSAHLGLLTWIPGLDIGNPPSAAAVAVQARAYGNSMVLPASWQTKIKLDVPVSL